MDPKRWSELQALFLDAVELPIRDREAYVRERAGDDEWLLGELLRMLDAHESASGFFEPPKPDDLAARISPPDYLRGTTLGEFELKEEIGRGGMGIVYRARQRSLERDVAVKVLPPALAVSTLRLERFRREALAASRLAHPGLVPILAFGSEEGIVYYAMELVEGPCLKDVLRGKAGGLGPTPGDPQSCAAFVAQLLGALHQVHEAGLVHRDVKPDNILVGQSGPVLIDFGLAKDLAMSGLTGTGDAAGSLHYMSPEQVRANRDGIDRRSDVYSAGAVLYELLVGQKPFPGSEPAELFARITSELPTAPRRLVKGLPRNLELVVMQALEKDRDDRYASAEAMAADLDRFLAGEPVLAKPPSLARRTERVLVKRRTILAAGAAALGAGLVGRYGYPALADGRGRLRIAHSTGGWRVLGPMDVSADRFASIWGGDVIESHEAGPLAPGEELELTLEAGLWQLTFRDASGRRAERIVRVLPDGRSLPDFVEVAELMTRREVTAALEMAEVTGGTVSVDFQTPVPQPAVVEVPSFLLSKRVVSRGQLRSVLTAAGSWPPPGWDAQGARNWDGMGSDELPATAIGAQGMRLYAAALGLRLPTAAEWLAAMTPTLGPWLASGGPERANLVQGPASGRPITNAVRSFADAVAPAAQPRGGWGPFDLHHPIGNVMELVESAHSLHLGDGGFPNEPTGGPGDIQHDVFVGLFWDNMSGHGPTALSRATSYIINSGQANCGFRCARSLV